MAVGKSAALRRWRLQIGGVVQGVGFRPFVYRLARRFALAGRIYNDAAGVVLELEGSSEQLSSLLAALASEAPPAARIGAIERRELAVTGERGFLIEASDPAGPPLAGVAPDLAICPDCLRELLDPADRRYLYPFINCTNCGPRYTIIEKIPYDRPNTSMRAFTMCPACQAEYDDPNNRRFHAQPNACPNCGPRLRLRRNRSAAPHLGTIGPACVRGVRGAGPLAPTWGTAERLLAVKPTIDGRLERKVGKMAEKNGEIAAAARRLLREGKIVALKGIGGFHLAVDATNEEAVQTLRRRKGREEKPLALMVADLATAGRLVELNPDQERELNSPARPILLALKKPDHGLAAAVAPANSRFGVMLAYAPLHYLLLGPELPVLVMTSANSSSEPLCIGNREAAERLVGLADAILDHDREIVRGNDDSVLIFPADSGKVFNYPAHAEGNCSVTKIFLRRGRGFAPGLLPLDSCRSALLGVGAELKNSVCLAEKGRAVLSQHLGDLQNLESYRLFEQTITDLAALFAINPQMVACDLHPDYLASRWARQWSQERGLPLLTVQHHHAHLAAVLAEHNHSGPAIGLILDGTGYGPDGTIWGGEILLGDAASFTRFGHLETMPLPGGDAAISEPWRAGLAYLHQAFAGAIPQLPFLQFQDGAPQSEGGGEGSAAAYRQRQELLLTMLAQKINCPLTSSCGRLFDAVAAICGVRGRINYEAQAAIELMQLADGLESPAFNYEIREEGEGVVMAIRPLIRDIARAVAAGEESARISRRFHQTLVEMFGVGVRQAAATGGLNTVALAGGVIQNELLLIGLERNLTAAGLKVLLPRQLPPNDGAIAYGQVAVASRSGLL